MKKLVSLVLVLVALVAVMSTAAFAAETYAPENDGTYTIPFTEGASGEFYALLVVEGIYEEDEAPEISEDTVLYIDQATADANGDVSFDGWIPKNDEPATVYLGGSNLTDGPVLLGYLGSSTFVVAGAVTTDSATTYEATVTLTDAENNVFTATSVNGAYTVEVPAGTYTFTVNVKNHLSYTDADFAVDADVSGKNVSVLGGDLDESGTVDFDDLSEILRNYKTVSDYDVDGVGEVDFDDLSIVLKNYKISAVAE